jgi:hypothetical protein
LFNHPSDAFVAGVVLLAAVVLMAVFVPTAPLAVEESWAEAMRDTQSTALTDVALVFNALGRGFESALSLTAVGIVLIVARRWFALVAFAVTEASSSIAALGARRNASRG